MGEKISTRELGLVLATRLLKTEDLHYGFWNAELPVLLSNLPQAQEAYTAHLLSHIPQGVQSVLDVGCGTGHVAQLLLEKGHQVQCVSPSAVLTQLARERLGNEVPIHQCTLQDLILEDRFDLILFSESFQYMPFTASLPKVHGLLKAGGHVLISDFFSLAAPGKSALRGGHKLDQFRQFLASQPFEVLRDLDITEQTAPNLKIIDDWLQDYALPLWESLAWYFRENRPWLGKLGRLLFGRKLDKVHFKYFSRQRNAETFKTHKSYRLLLLRRKD